MYSLLPFWIRARLAAWRMVRVLAWCPCDACDTFHAAHHRTCCDCRACRRYWRANGSCWVCAVNA